MALQPRENTRQSGYSGRSAGKTAGSAGKNQQIVTCGFTPTDALHCLGALDLGDREASMAGARHLSAYHHLEISTFAEHILTLARDTIARTILEYVAGREVHQGLAAFLHRKEDNPLIDVTITIKPPIIGIGAGAPFSSHRWPHNWAQPSPSRTLSGG